MPSALRSVLFERRALRRVMDQAPVIIGSQGRLSFRRSHEEDQTAQQGKDLFEPEAEMGDEERFGRAHLSPHQVDKHELPDPLSPNGRAQDSSVDHDGADKQDIEEAHMNTMHSHGRAEIHQAGAEVRNDPVPHRPDDE